MPKQKQVSEDVRRFVRQLHELEMRVLDGTLDSVAIRQPLQAILTGQLEGQAVGVVACPVCAATMVRIGKWYVCPSCGATTRVYRPSWYVSPEQQLVNVQRWNKQRSWGFADSDFPSEIPDFTPNSPLEVLVLAVYLPDQGEGADMVPGYIRTANELWAIACSFQPNWEQQDTLRLDADHLRLLPGTEDAHASGIRWTVLDLGAHWDKQYGIRPRDVRGENSAHAELLAAAAHFPHWIQAMDGEKAPYVWLPGYQAKFPGEDAWAYVPILSYGRAHRELCLDASWAGKRYLGYAVPRVRDIKS